MVGADVRHFGPRCQGLQGLGVAGDDDGVGDPQGLRGLHVAGGLQFVQQDAQLPLAALGGGLQRVHHRLAAGQLLLHLTGGAQIGLLPQVDDEGGLALGRQFLEQLRFDDGLRA